MIRAWLLAPRCGYRGITARLAVMILEIVGSLCWVAQVTDEGMVTEC